MLTPKIDYQYLRFPRPNDARLIMNSCPNQKLKKNNKHPQPLLPPQKNPNEQTKPRPSGGGLLGEGGGQTMNSYQLAGKGKAIYNN